MTWGLIGFRTEGALSMELYGDHHRSDLDTAPHSVTVG